MLDHVYEQFDAKEFDDDVIFNEQNTKINRRHYFDTFLKFVTFNDSMNENIRNVNFIRFQIANFNNFFDFSDRTLSCSTHWRIEISSRFSTNNERREERLGL